jgi:hypothetical protein
LKRSTKQRDRERARIIAPAAYSFACLQSYFTTHWPFAYLFIQRVLAQQRIVQRLFTLCGARRSKITPVFAPCFQNQLRHSSNIYIDSREFFLVLFLFSL